MARWLELQSFTAVAEEGGFAAGARRLELTPSAVSKHVARLEDRLGVRLFQRTTRRVSLTEAGRAFLERIRGPLDEVEDAERAVRDLAGDLRGSLRVSVPLDFGRLHLVDRLAAFAVRHPELALDAELSDRFVDPVDEGFDAVVRIGALRDSSLVVRRLTTCRRLLCASPAYLDRHGTPAVPAALTRHRLVGFAYESERSWRFRDPAGGPEHVPVVPHHRSNAGTLHRALLLEGAGIGLAPTFLVGDDLRAGRLRAVLPDALDADTTIHVLYSHRRHLSAKVRAFVDALAEHCGEPPYWDAGLPRSRAA